MRSAALSRREFLAASVAAMPALGLGACRSVRSTDQRLDIASLQGDVARVVEALTRSIPRTMARQDIPGLSIALVQHGAVVWAERAFTEWRCSKALGDCVARRRELQSSAWATVRLLGPEYSG